MTDLLSLPGPAFLPDLMPVLPGLLFGLFAVIAVVAAVAAATVPRIVHAAFLLLGTLFGVAGLYALLGADFVALTQILVYVGGILILLVFGVLLTGEARRRLGLEEAPRRLYPFLAGLVLLVGLLWAIGSTEWSTAVPGEPQATTAKIGTAFLDPKRYLVPFELASVLLLAALIGAAYLVRRRREP